MAVAQQMTPLPPLVHGMTKGLLTFDAMTSVTNDESLCL
jgi:hypothetical protein